MFQTACLSMMYQPACFSMLFQPACFSMMKDNWIYSKCTQFLILYDQQPCIDLLNTKYGELKLMLIKDLQGSVWFAYFSSYFHLKVKKKFYFQIKYNQVIFGYICKSFANFENVQSCHLQHNLCYNKGYDAKICSWRIMCL